MSKDKYVSSKSNKHITSLPTCENIITITISTECTHLPEECPCYCTLLNADSRPVSCEIYTAVPMHLQRARTICSVTVCDI